jgi:PAS domain S-box-containing protein
MGRRETNIATDEIGQGQSAEREVQALRAELAQRDNALKEAQVRLEQEIAQRDCVIAEGEQIQAELRESETALRQLFDQNLDSMMIIDLETGRYIEVNDEYIRHSGYSREEVVGRRSRELPSMANVEENLKLVAELKRAGVVRNMEATFRRKDGSTYSGLISALNTKLRGHWCCVTITRDIGALKETQRELIAAREVALEASRAKSDFLSSMSHEIRTPMNAVLGMADMLAEGDLNTEQQHYLDIIRSNGVILLDLINDILDLAKIESGHLSFEEVDFDIRELIDTVAESMGLRAHQKQLELTGHVAPDVPRTLIGDPLRLRQVIANLLGNAIKFTDQGGIVLEVDVARADNGCGTALIRFTVTDTGIGIDADQTDSIFTAFTQADSSTTRRYGGTGLGLAIVKRLVEMYRGEITVTSEVGTGSTFSFTAEFKTRSPRAAIATPASALDLTGMRMLVVDDTAANRVILEQALTSRGASVACVDSGRAALDELDRAAMLGESYRAMLLDCRMAGMDGIEVAARIRDGALAPRDRPIILMLTSDDLSETMARARAVGIKTYMIKPIKRAELYEALDRALGIAGSSSQSSCTSAVDATAAGNDLAEMRPLKILLADDSPDNRLLVQAYFKKMPYTIDEAENGAMAVEMFKGCAYDLVLMDIEMPIMDGYSATRAIRAIENETGRGHVPILALTASVLTEALGKALEAGCDAHIAKPVKKATLLAAVHKAISDADGCGARPTA